MRLAWFAPAAACLLVGFAGPVHASNATFNFQDVASGTLSPFSDTVNGITATFSSPSDPGGFEVQSTMGLTVLLSSQALITNVSSAPLVVTFNQPVTGLSLDFGTLDLPGTPPSTLTFQYFDGGVGGTLVGAGSESGAVQAGGVVPEGVESFASPFDTMEVNISAGTATVFGVDHIAVSTAGTAVPEPGLTGLIVAGVVSLAGFARRRSR